MILTLAMAAILGDGPRDLDLTLTNASLFKNGYAVVLREAKVPASGEFIIHDVPQAGLGTFWVMTSPGTHLESMTNESSVSTTERFASSLDELLSLNMDKELEITYYGNQTSVKARILSTNGQIVLFKVGDEIRAINKGGISSIRASDKLIYKTKDSSTTRVLHLKVVAGQNATVKFLSLEKGLSWSPSYYVDISDPKSLTMVAKCTLIDDLSEVKDASLRLVTGFPNFQHATSLDPMSFFQTIVQATGFNMNQAYGQFGGGIGGGGGGRMMDRSEVQSVADAFAGGAIPGGGNEDLFYYDLPHVSMKQSDRVYQPMFDAKASYEHVYRLDIDEGRSAETNSNRNLAPLEVWHTLVFTNPMSQPLTTAPAMVVSKGDVLGQSTIEYTPMSAKVRLNLTKALDIPADIHEEEVSRNRITLIGRVVDEVLVKGRIRIENRKGSPIHLEVRKDLVGLAKDLNEGGQVEKTTQGLSELNPHSKLKWDANLEGFKVLDLTYSYSVRL